MNVIRVLVADDHATIRDALKLLLNRQPDIQIVGEAADGQQAGAAGYALKQSSSADLVKAIHTVAGGKPYVAPGFHAEWMEPFAHSHAVRVPPETTPRETETLRYTAWGWSNKDIATRLGVSVKTVEVHKTN